MTLKTSQFTLLDILTGRIKANPIKRTTGNRNFPLLHRHVGIENLS